MSIDEALAQLAFIAGYDGSDGAAQALDVVEREVERLRAIEARAVEMADYVLTLDHPDAERAMCEADVAGMVLDRRPAYPLVLLGRELQRRRDSS